MMKFSEKRKTTQHNFSPQNSSRSSLRNLPFLRMFAFPIGGPRNRKKGTSIVGTYVTMTTWQRKRFEKFRSWGWPLSILLFFLFFFILTLRQPTMGFAFSLVRQVSVRDLERGSKIRCSLSASSKVLTISNNLTDFKGSSLRRWFGARNYKSAASQLFFQFSICCLFYSWKVISPALFSRIFELSDH